jgi:class 3 adenylate cyclase/tetratricopeptide (TPR) repeat protein
MHCFSCGHENSERKRFCIQCGANLSLRCSRCRSENLPEARFCGDCGAKLEVSTDPRGTPVGAQDPPAIRITPEQTDASLTLEGERKMVTALFADIKGSTELMRDLDPEDARAIVDPVLKRMMAAVRSYGGYIPQSTGDGVFALFGAPLAHEDHPQRALYAALAIQGELRVYAESMRAKGQFAVEARVGVNTGEVVVRTIDTGGHAEYTPVGHVINLAARLQTVAPTGGIAISENTRSLVEGYFELRAAGRNELNGLREAVNVYEVIGLGPLRSRFQLAARRGLTKFVGREAEIVQLRQALGQVKAGHGKVLAAVGEPGTGKSRLFYELKKDLPDDWTVLEVSPLAYGRTSAYLPVIDLFRSYFEITDQDDAAVRREKIAAKTLASDRSLENSLPTIYWLLGIHEGKDPLAGLPPQARTLRTLDTLKRILLNESLKRPVLIIFEDLHWIDKESQGFLDLLVGNLAKLRVLLLVSYRPEYSHEWSTKAQYAQLQLEPLGSESVTEMLEVLLGSEPSLDALKLIIIQKTEGNPLFIEEWVRVLFQRGVLVQNGTVSLGKPLTEVEIPPTVQSILASRIDLLPAVEKEVLQLLALLGAGPSRSLVERVSAKDSNDLDRVLSHLESGDFIYEQSSQAGIQYRFKHALVQEVAYNSMLVERRKILHERAGQALESLFNNQLDDHLSELAHHYSHSANTLKAVEYLHRSAQQAAQRWAYSEALSYFSRGLVLLKPLPDEHETRCWELDLQLGIGQVSFATKGAGPETLDAFNRARVISEQVRVAHHPYLNRALGITSMLVHRGQNYSAAREIWNQLIAIGENTQQAAMIAEGEYGVGMCFYFTSELPKALEHLQRAVLLLDLESHGEAVAISVILAVTLLLLGFPDQAQRRGNEAFAATKRSNQPFVQIYSFILLSSLQRFLGNVSATKQMAELGIALAEKNGVPVFKALLAAYFAWALAEEGRIEQAFSEMQKSIAAHEAAQVPLSVFVLRTFTEIYLLAGRVDEGLVFVRDGLATAVKTGERAWNAELTRLRGELLLMKDASAEQEAEECFRSAITTARQDSMKYFELRAAMSLARLLKKQNLCDQARMMLAEIYGWFTEGFDTADLKDAKALLDELRA